MSLFLKSQAAILDYTVDWGPYLAGIDTIQSVSWVVPNQLTVSGQTNSTTTASIRIAGGVVGKEYAIVNRITMVSGQIDERSFTLQVGAT